MMGCVEASEPPILTSDFGSAESSDSTDNPTSLEDTTGETVAVDGAAETENGDLPLSDAVAETQEEGDSKADDVEGPEDGQESDGDVLDALDVDWGEDPECSFPYGATVTVQLLDDEIPVPAYPVDHPAVATVAYAYDGNAILRAVDEWGETWWEIEVGSGELTGGFDANGDGWPDVGLVVTEETSGQLCGGIPLQQSRLIVVDGFSGEVSEPLAATVDHCQESEEETTPGILTPQWNAGSVLFGETPGALSFLQAFGTSGWFASWEEQWSLNSFVFPSTASFGATYPVASKEAAWEEGAKHVPLSHQGSGLLVDTDEGEKLVLFTSGRVLQYNYGAYGEAQLLVDHPFLSGDRKDLEGRNEGLVARDPLHPESVVLLAGTDVFSLFVDRITGSQAEDPWGGTERHFALYNIATDGLDDRFFSNARDAQNGHQYEGRIAYPANPFVQTQDNAPGPQVAYNVFEKGRWNLHISAPGSTEDLLVYPGLFLWNIQDLDGNGTAEWVISPTDSEEDQVDTPAYLPFWETRVYQWDGSSLLLAGKWEGVIPYLLPRFREPNASAYRGTLASILVRAEGCSLTFAARSGTGSEIQWIPLGQ